MYMKSYVDFTWVTLNLPCEIPFISKLNGLNPIASEIDKRVLCFWFKFETNLYNNCKLSTLLYRLMYTLSEKKINIIHHG